MTNIYDVLHSLGPLEVNITENLINLLPGNVFVVDPEGYLLWGNQRMLDVLHLKSLDDYIGKHISYWDKHSWECCKAIIKSGMELVEEEFYQDRYYITNRKPLFSAKKELVAILGTALDVTEQKSAEVTKQEFLMNMAHDLRTPLAGIIGLSSAMDGNEPKEKIKEYGCWIQGAGEQLLELLNAVLDTLNTEYRREQVQLKPIYLSQLANELQTLMKPSLEAKQLGFSLKLDKLLPPIMTDRIKLKRLLINLLSNAVKFTQQGKISFEIKLLEVNNQRAKIAMTIADTGIGIAEAKFDKIFDRFYRDHPSYLGVYTGYGLGLCLVKKATELLGGNIQVSSKQGEGSCFSLEFNFPLAKDKDCILTNDSESSSFQPNINRLGVVLVAEDNALVSYALKAFLTNLGYEVVVVTEGEAALDALQNQTFIWALLDIGLPKLQGTEIVRQYRYWEKQNNKYHLPIFALTAHAQKKIKDQCKQAGFDYVLQKPFTERDFNIIEKFLNN